MFNNDEELIISDEYCTDTLSEIFRMVNPLKDTEYNHFIVEYSTDNKKFMKIAIKDILYNHIDKKFIWNFMSIQQIETLSFNELFEDVEKKLLEDYAPKLFNTYSTPDKLQEVIFKWVLLFYDYKIQNLRKEDFKIRHIEKHYNNSSIPYKKHKMTDQEVSFQNHIKDLLNLLGGVSGFDTPKGRELKEVLEKVLDNHPRDYIPLKPKIIKSTTSLKDYLIDLKLIGKSELINDFIKAI